MTKNTIEAIQQDKGYDTRVNHSIETTAKAYTEEICVVTDNKRVSKDRQGGWLSFK